MTLIKKGKSDWRDVAGTKCTAPRITRRQAIQMGLVTSTATAILPTSLLGLLGQDAHAALTCPPQVSDQTGFVQIQVAGGWNPMSVFWPVDPNGIAKATATDVTNNGAKWGINDANATFQVAKGQVLNGNDVFTAALRLAPTGFSQAAWDAILSNNVTFATLNSTSNDDNRTDQRGCTAGVVLAKSAQINTTISANIGGNFDNAESGVNGTPASLTVQGTINALSGAASFPAAAQTSGGPNGYMAITQKYIGQLKLPLTNALMPGRRSLAGIDTLFRCAEPDAVRNADVTYGQTLFNPTNQAELQANTPENTFGFNPSGLSQAQQTEMMIAFRACKGTILAGALKIGGADYHGTNPTNISSVHLDIADKVKHTILGMILSGQKGMIRIFTDGSAVASGTDPAVGNPNAGTVPNATVPTARNDSGGSFGTQEALIFVNANASQLVTPKHIGFYTATGDVDTRTAGNSIGLDFRYATAAALLSLARLNGNPNAINNLLQAFAKSGYPIRNAADATRYTAIV